MVDFLFSLDPARMHHVQPAKISKFEPGTIVDYMA